MDNKLSDAELRQARARLQTAAHLQSIEENPLTESDWEMFNMFERERWSHERCIQHILSLPRE